MKKVILIFVMGLIHGMEKSIPVSALEDTIGYTFKKPSRLTKALTTKCANPKKNYEKYELHGDTILHLALTEMLLKLKLPKRSPDSITQARAALEQNAILALLGEKLRVDRYIILGVQKMKDAILADVMEALVCAVYKDGGPQAAQKFIERFWCPLLKDKTSYPLPPKVIIQQWEEASGKVCDLKRTRGKQKGSREEYLQEVAYIRNNVSVEFQKRLPILPTDSEYVCSIETGEILIPSWAENLLEYGHRVRLNDIAQRLHLTVVYTTLRQTAPRWETLLRLSDEMTRITKYAGVSCGGETRKMAQECAAQHMLECLMKGTHLDISQKEFLAGIKITQEKNARKWLHEFAQFLQVPPPSYSMPEGANQTFSVQVQFKDMDDAMVTVNEDTLRNAQECAAGILLRQWYCTVQSAPEAVSEPRKYVECLAKYHGMKKPLYEDWSAARKLTDPAYYFSKVIDRENNIVAIGEQCSSVVDAQESAARKAILALTTQKLRPVRSNFEDDFYY